MMEIELEDKYIIEAMKNLYVFLLIFCFKLVIPMETFKSYGLPYFDRLVNYNAFDNKMKDDKGWSRFKENLQEKVEDFTAKIAHIGHISIDFSKAQAVKIEYQSEEQKKSLFEIVKGQIIQKDSLDFDDIFLFVNIVKNFDFFDQKMEVEQSLNNANRAKIFCVVWRAFFEEIFVRKPLSPRLPKRVNNFGKELNECMRGFSEKGFIAQVDSELILFIRNGLVYSSENPFGITLWKNINNIKSILGIKYDENLNALELYNLEKGPNVEATWLYRLILPIQSHEEKLQEEIGLRMYFMRMWKNKFIRGGAFAISIPLLIWFLYKRYKK